VNVALCRAKYKALAPALTERARRIWAATEAQKPSTAKSYHCMVKHHLRPAFGGYRSDRFTLLVVEEWRAGIAWKIAAGTMAPKFYLNLRNLLSAIVDWARHPNRRYLAHDPLGGLPKIDLPKTKKRPHFEPVQVAELLTAAAASPPDDTIIPCGRLLRLASWRDLWVAVVRYRRGRRGRRADPRSPLDLPGRDHHVEDGRLGPCG